MGVPGKSTRCFYHVLFLLTFFSGIQLSKTWKVGQTLCLVLRPHYPTRPDSQTGPLNTSSPGSYLHHLLVTFTLPVGLLLGHFLRQRTSFFKDIPSPVLRSIYFDPLGCQRQSNNFIPWETKLIGFFFTGSGGGGS